MCGISAVFGKIDNIALENVMNLCLYNTDRGALATGVLGITRSKTNGDSAFTWKSEGFNPKNLRSFLWSLEPSMLRGIVCHTKAPTDGEISLETVQPARARNLYLIHNGMILDWKSLPTVDSQPYDTGALVHYFRDQNECYSISNVYLLAALLSEIEGQMSCILFDDITKEVFVWRVMSTLYMMQDRGVTFLSSKSPSQLWDRVSEGKLYRIPVDVKSPNLQEVQTFDFYSPYRTQEVADETS